MKKIVRLTESDLTRIVRRVLQEEKYSEEDLKYTHPHTGESCKIKVGIFKPSIETENKKYQAVLVCPLYDEDFVVAQIPVIKNSFNDVRDFICKNIEKTYEILDKIIPRQIGNISESVRSTRFQVIDEPLNCKLDFNN